MMDNGYYFRRIVEFLKVVSLSELLMYKKASIIIQRRISRIKNLARRIKNNPFALSAFVENSMKMRTPN